ncbi:MAG: DNA-directed RNA polymerase subunit beta [Gemmatimonadetes bacterium]|nr:DNA-directed RNA polymerase subunit beta [Gemmatimonadota bacterium]
MPSVSLSKLPGGMAMPNLLDVQIRAFSNLLKTHPIDAEPEDVGLERVFHEVFPITDVNNRFSLEFVTYSLGEPKYSVEECIERDMTYAAPLKSTLRLVVWEDVEDGERRPKDIIEKEVYLGDLPLLTDLGTFIINGSERVIVSQLHRSPGVVFEETVHPHGSKLFSARIIPFRGSWVEFTVDIHDVIYVHIDKKKKFPATALLRAFGYGTDEGILRLFYTAREQDLTDEITDPKSQRRDVLGSLVAEEVVDPETGEVIAEIAEELTIDLYNRLRRAGVTRVQVFTSGVEGRSGESPLLKNTLRKDPTENEEDALRAIYSLLRPGDPPNIETARLALERIFFNPKRYDLGRVGRYKINQRLGVDMPAGHTVLTQEDFIAIIRYLIDLNEGRGYVDDIDHLGNRRVRSVGELIANQFSVGLSRMARLVKERMSITTDVDKMNIDDLVNARTVSAVIQAFFGSSQLSQFMDQTNPLAELTHMRRLSALGPGGLTRERAGFEVRDVHYSHYGRMCPIETPEGPNIGLITSLTTYARINDLGFIETPYRKVVNGQVTDEILWLDANAEEHMMVAQANAPLNEDGTSRNEFVLCRVRGDFPLASPDQIDAMDVAPDQLVSVAAALIPFLEHDDANRALMGSNMQRQAVPLLYPAAPVVGTGLEEKVARDSGAVILARRGGIVQRVTADEIIIDTGSAGNKSDEPLAKLAQFDRYRLKKYWRTNQDTAINQRPLVNQGQYVAQGEIIADGASTEQGELALGRNVLVAFMPWYGHNFEDAIVLSERMVKDDVYTSIHIQELELHVRDTKRGMEEITREIPNVAEESLTHLDERGIVRIGARVKAGDILVGKITPKGETELSPEEKLLTAIFGEKAKDVKDSSLKVPPGMEGTIIDVKVFSRRIDDTLLEKERGDRIGRLRTYEREEIHRISEARDEELKELLAGHTVTLMLKRGTVEPYLDEGTQLTPDVLAALDLTEVDLTTLKVQNRESNDRIRRVITEAKSRIEKVRERTEEQIDKVFQPDELSPGVVQLVKVYIAEKRKVSVGDKMAGRHGNKGIVARIVPEEDMPFLPDGTAVDIVLNPLGVPSRMNVGQILETHLGWVCRMFGFEAKTPVFQGASEDEIGALMKIAGLRWAHHANGITTPFPGFGKAESEQMLKAMYRINEGLPSVTPSKNGTPTGLGKSLDAYLDRSVPQPVRDKLEELARYLVAARTELVARAEGAGEQLFPAIAALAGKKSLKEGLDDAVIEFLTSIGLTPYGKIWLRDGRTGERFEHPITVGMIYMLKLSHLVDDKIHARSIGPYSLVTQQPLAGKAQFGGQRFGEMEVWALEAYGAAHTLQEILTVKSDDVSGRSRVYEAIVKGENLPEPGIPESFNVLVKELQSLGLSVTLGREE